MTGAILIGLGFSPLAASGLSLIANTAPVAYGALGTPIAGLASVTGLDPYLLGAMVGRQLPFFSLIVPFWLIWAFAGRRGMIGDLAGDPGLRALLCDPAIPDLELHQSLDRRCRRFADLDGLLDRLPQVWQPKELWLSPALRTRDDSASSAPPVAPAKTDTPTSAAVLRSLLPWIIVCVILLIWGTGWFKSLVNPIFTWNYPVAGLHNLVQKVPPVVAKPAPEAAVFAFTYISFTGSGMLLAAIISGFVMGFSPAKLVVEYGRTIKVCAYSLITISAMLAIGTLTRYSGIDATLGLAFAGAGVLYPFFGTLLGWLGVALTGSDTASNVLFGGLQKITARATRPLADPHERGQFLGRRHGQDDRRPVDRGGVDRDQLVRA